MAHLYAKIGVEPSTPRSVNAKMVYLENFFRMYQDVQNTVERATVNELGASQENRP